MAYSRVPDVVIFLLSTAVIVLTAVFGNHFWTGAEKTPQNFMYGAPACVKGLMESVDMTILSGQEALHAGWSEPVYATYVNYNSQIKEFQDGAEYDFPYNLLTNSEFGNEVLREVPELAATTARSGLQGQTTSTTKEATTVTRAAKADFNREALGIVFNLDTDYRVSPALKEDGNKKCEKILAQRRYSSDYSMFDDHELAQFLVCNAVYGWPLGEYCDTWENGVKNFGDFIFGKDVGGIAAFSTSADQSNAMTKLCYNATRQQCSTKYVGGQNGIAETQTDNNNKVPSFFTVTDGNVVQTQIQANPCVMMNGIGQGDAERKYDAPIRGTMTSPMARQKYYDDYHNPGIDTDDPDYHFAETAVMQMTASKNGNPVGEVFGLEALVGTFGAGVDTPDPTDPWARVGSKHGMSEVDQKYVAERIIYDALVLGEMSELVGREQEFYDRLPSECFSDGVSPEVLNFNIVSSAFLISAILGTAAKGFFGRAGLWFQEDGNEGIVNFNNYILPLLASFIGVITTTMLGAFSGQYGDPGNPNDDLSEWAGVVSLAEATDGLNDQGNAAAAHLHGDGAAEAQTTREFLNDIGNGMFNRYTDLSGGDQAILFSLLIIYVLLFGISIATTVAKMNQEKGFGTADLLG